jgi:hypothetical protein
MRRAQAAERPAQLTFRKAGPGRTRPGPVIAGAGRVESRWRWVVRDAPIVPARHHHRDGTEALRERGAGAA